MNNNIHSDFSGDDAESDSPTNAEPRSESDAVCFEGSYTCDCCGEEIVIPLDPSSGGDEQYVEDCPVCCHPHVIHVDWHDETPRVSATPEQDRY